MYHEVSIKIRRLLNGRKSLTSRVETSLKGSQFGVTISNASKGQVYEAMMRSVRDILMERNSAIDKH